METNEKITAFLPVFKQRLDWSITGLKEEIKKPKKERNKESLKRLLKEAKELKLLVKELDENTTKCPNCGHIL